VNAGLRLHRNICKDTLKRTSGRSDYAGESIEHVGKKVKKVLDAIRQSPKISTAIVGYEFAKRTYLTS